MPLNQGADLRHIYAPQANALRSRPTGLADVVQTGIVKSDLAKAKALESSEAVESARNGMAEEKSALEAKNKAEQESLAPATPAPAPTKPLDLADAYAPEYIEEDAGDFGEAGYDTPVAPSESGQSNALANSIAVNIGGVLVGLAIGGITGNPIAATVANQAFKGYVGKSMAGQQAAEAHASSVLGPSMTPNATMGLTGNDLDSFSFTGESDPGFDEGPALSLFGHDINDSSLTHALNSNPSLAAVLGMDTGIATSGPSPSGVVDAEGNAVVDSGGHAVGTGNVGPGGSSLGGLAGTGEGQGGISGDMGGDMGGDAGGGGGGGGK